MTFFVKYNGDLEKDPLDRGVEDFADYESAFEFAKRMTNKGLATTIYSGVIMEMKYQATFAERNKTLDELTKQAQELGFYDTQLDIANKVMEEDKEVLKELSDDRW